MRIALQALTDGLVIGSVYGLVAVGFNLIYGVVGILNTAHANFMMLGAFTSLLVVTAFGGGLIFGLTAGIIVGIVAGALLYVTVLRWIEHRQVLAVFIATLGVSIFLENAVARVAGTRPRVYPKLIPNTFRQVGPVQVSDAQLAIVVLMVVSILALSWWIRSTRTGREIRALAEDSVVAATLGINVARLRLLTVVVASAVAALTGVLLSNLFGSIGPFIGQSVALKMFIVALVAGGGSLGGSAIVGLSLGGAEGLVVAYLGSSWQDIAGLIGLVVVLLVRPDGLMGRSIRAG